MYKILLNKNLSKDATDYYLKIIYDSLDKCSFVDNVKDIQPKDIVIVVDAKDFCKVYFKNRKQKIIIWFQGVVPEEAYLVFNSRIKKFYWEIFEKLALKKSYFNIFVSQRMVNHYKEKYNYKKSNYLIMPCFNKLLNNDAFFYPNKYENNSFVYAGSLAKWQKVEKTLEVYKIIENKLSNTSITIITSQIDKATLLCNELKIKNFTVKYIPYDKVDGELEKYKYGFILRDDIAVNNVATPTKISTYMANGIIPIYTDCIGDFSIEFFNLTYKIELVSNLNIEDIAERIIDYNDYNNLINPEAIRNEYNNLFATFYNSYKYKSQFVKIFGNL